jgi:hypothetical protein
MNANQLRRCNTCKEIKFVDHFYKCEFKSERRCIECTRILRARKPKPRILQQLFQDKSL